MSSHSGARVWLDVGETASEDSEGDAVVVAKRLQQRDRNDVERTPGIAEKLTVCVHRSLNAGPSKVPASSVSIRARNGTQAHDISGI